MLALVAPPLGWMGVFAAVIYILTFRRRTGMWDEFSSSADKVALTISLIGGLMLVCSLLFGPLIHLMLKRANLTGQGHYLWAGAFLGGALATVATILLWRADYSWVSYAPNWLIAVIPGIIFGGSCASIGWMIRRPDFDE